MTVRLNQYLLANQGISKEREEEIIALHDERLKIEEEAKDASGEQLQKLYREWVANQYALQRAWKFMENSAMHRFWRFPQCTCPKMDNEDMYPAGPYWVDGTCPIHEMEK